MTGTSRAPGLFLRGSARIDAKHLFGPIELDLPAGGWTCLLGPSGVGKSTILNLFADLAKGITLDGSWGADDNVPLQGRVALMAQEDLLMPWLTLLENVSIGARLRRGKPGFKPCRDVIGRCRTARPRRQTPD